MGQLLESLQVLLDKLNWAFLTQLIDADFLVL